MQRFHLRPHQDRWVLTRDGATGRFLYDEKERAVADAFLAMDAGEGTLEIHRGDGSLEEERAAAPVPDAVILRG